MGERGNYAKLRSRYLQLFVLDVARAAYDAGATHVHDCVRAALTALSEGLVETTFRGEAMLPANLRDCGEWAKARLARLALSAKTSDAQVKGYHNIGLNLARGIKTDVALKRLVAMPITPGRRVVLCGRRNGGEAEPTGKPVEPVRVRRPVPRRAIQFKVPGYLDGLDPAPQMPDVWGDTVAEGEGYRGAKNWRDSHQWWTGMKPRERECRGEELDRLLRSCEPLYERRGWEPAGPTPEVKRAAVEIGDPDVAGEAVLNLRGPELISDRLWRVTSDHQHFLWNRQRFPHPEETCVMGDLDPEHKAFDNMARAGVPTDKVMWGLSQMVHGYQTEIAGKIARAVTTAAGEERVQAEFRCCGINTVAMKWDEMWGSDAWDISACYEANPYVAWMHDEAWGDRVKNRFERAETIPNISERVNVAFDSTRCQPFCQMNIRGINDLERAQAERQAVYAANAASDPNVIFDEMLSRMHMAGISEAWRRTEYIREQVLPGYRWIIFDCDPGDLNDTWMCSRREIACGVKPEYVGVVERILRENGFKRL